MALQEYHGTRERRPVAHYAARDGYAANGRSIADEERLANGLGWFSIGLGLAEVVAPGRLANLIGIEDDERNRMVLRAFGLREIAAGIGILSQRRPAGWMWGRVAGDAADLAFLGAQIANDRSKKDRVGAAAAAVLGVTLLDIFCGQQLSRNGHAHAVGKQGAVSTTKVITIQKPAEELYAFWRNFANLPRFMRHLEEVRLTPDGRSHWKAKAPFGHMVEWDSEVTEDRPNEYIAWRSLPDADVPNRGSVRFAKATGGRGTTVRVELHYDPPGGVVGATLAKLFGREPGQEVQESLRTFKQVIESGEMIRSDSTSKGWGSGQPAALPRHT